MFKLSLETAEDRWYAIKQPIAVMGMLLLGAVISYMIFTPFELGLWAYFGWNYNDTNTFFGVPWYHHLLRTFGIPLAILLGTLLLSITRVKRDRPTTF